MLCSELEPLTAPPQYRINSKQNKFLGLNYDEREWKYAEVQQSNPLMAYRPSEKQKNTTLKDLFRQQTLKNTAK